jgi:hypothetical protein
MGASFKTAFCVKCAKDQPFRIVKVPEPSRPLSTRWKTRKKRLCMVCSEEVAPAESKYRNVPTRSKHTGRLFQSKKEASHEPSLLALQAVGAIKNLRYQVPFRLELYATGAVDALLTFIAGPNSNCSSPTLQLLAEDVRRSRQSVAKYVADFVFEEDGRLVVQDVKGAVTPVYRMKRALMRLAHNVEIVEPSSGGVQQRARGAGIRGRGTGSRLFGGR